MLGLLATASAACLHGSNLADGRHVVTGALTVETATELVVGPVRVPIPAGTAHRVSCQDETFGLDGPVVLGELTVRGPVRLPLHVHGRPPEGDLLLAANLLEPVVLWDGTPVSGEVLVRCGASCTVVGGVVAQDHEVRTSDDELLTVRAGARVFDERVGEVTRSVWLGEITGDLGHRPIQEALFRQQSPQFEVVAACTSVGDVREGRADCQGTVLARKYDPEALGVAQRRSLRGRVGIRVGLATEGPRVDPALVLTLEDTSLGDPLQLTFGDTPVVRAAFGHPLPFDVRVVADGGALCGLESVELDLFPARLPGFACWTGEGEGRRRVELR
jgi:hypothetical protein